MQKNQDENKTKTPTDSLQSNLGKQKYHGKVVLVHCGRFLSDFDPARNSTIQGGSKYTLRSITDRNVTVNTLNKYANSRKKFASDEPSRFGVPSSFQPLDRLVGNSKFVRRHVSHQLTSASDSVATVDSFSNDLQLKLHVGSHRQQQKNDVCWIRPHRSPRRFFSTQHDTCFTTLIPRLHDEASWTSQLVELA